MPPKAIPENTFNRRYQISENTSVSASGQMASRKFGIDAPYVNRNAN